MDSRAQYIEGLCLVFMLFRAVLARSTTLIPVIPPKERATNGTGILIVFPGNLTKESVKDQIMVNPASTKNTTTTAIPPTRMGPSTASFLDIDKTSRGYRCFHRGTWYRPGQEISTGQVLNWCFGSYCDYDGLVKHWDDVHCQFPITQPKTNTTTTTSITKSSPVNQSRNNLVLPPTTQIVPTTTIGFGCEYMGKWYWPGETASYDQVGTVCYGYNCDTNSKLVYYEELCAPTASPMYDATTGFNMK